MIDKFLNIEIEEPPIELQLSVEMRIRDVLNSDDHDGVKRYCTHLIRHQTVSYTHLTLPTKRIV